MLHIHTTRPRKASTQSDNDFKSGHLNLGLVLLGECFDENNFPIGPIGTMSVLAIGSFGAHVSITVSMLTVVGRLTRYLISVAMLSSCSSAFMRFYTQHVLYVKL